jgi:hypothetical protein
LWNIHSAEQQNTQYYYNNIGKHPNFLFQQTKCLYKNTAIESY